MLITNLTSNSYVFPGLVLGPLSAVTVPDSWYLFDETFKHKLNTLYGNSKVGVSDPPDGFPVSTAAEDEESADGSDSGGSQPVLVATKVLTNAQVKALPTTPVQVLAAPGASKIAVPLHATLRLAWTADYTGIDAGATLGLKLGTGSGSGLLAQNVGGQVADLLAGGGPDGTTAWLPFLAFAPASASKVLLVGYSGNYDSDVEDKAVTVYASNALAFTGGDAANTLTVTLLYYVVDF